MGTEASAITYTGLPINSGGAHSLGRMKRTTAFDQTMKFIERCTHLTMPIKYSFRVFQLKGSQTKEVEKRIELMYGCGSMIGQNLTFDVPSKQDGSLFHSKLKGFHHAE